MLYQLLVNHPEAIVQIVKNTPAWVGGLFAGLMVLGITQLRDRTQGQMRVALVPVAMTGFSIWGMVSGFGSSPHFTAILAVWVATAAIVATLMSFGNSGARYDAATRTYALPGSVLPLFLIAGIFLTKYAVGVELAMQPQLVKDASFAIPVAAAYGLFNGLFTGRAARLWKLALRPSPVAAAA